eukprot:TRINITY_DN41853_c0_g1_i2.p2 TRINITY_DN41853_c0_g1~~TRINITY_DN41853_c0_g1_i2.p2  ORF type:complete len:104 (+),score=11.88 TRINITY_DN41853_c0_g1_i2:211-522(+)
MILQIGLSNGSISAVAKEIVKLIEDNLGFQLDIDCTKQLIEEGQVAISGVGAFNGCSMMGCEAWQKSVMFFFSDDECKQDWDCTERGFHNEFDCKETCMQNKK